MLFLFFNAILHLFFRIICRIFQKVLILPQIKFEMRKYIILLTAMLLLCATSCKKTRYCRCTTIQNDEVVNLGEDFYTIEDGSSCSDRAKEIVGWGQVICTEVSKAEATGEENKWWENLFGIGGGKN